MEYNVNHRNKVKRVPNRGHYDSDTVYAILDDTALCHISFIHEEQPFIIPTIYGRKGNTLYIHGATSSRLLKTLEKGASLSLAVTHLDGLVLARSAFHHSMNYRSVVIYGKAKVVSNDKKLEALKVISDQIIKHRWEEARLPNEKELKATTILKIDIDQASAKIRTGGPSDEKVDYDLDIWAGVIPLRHIAEKPIEDELSKNEYPVPISVERYIDEINQ